MGVCAEKSRCDLAPSLNNGIDERMRPPHSSLLLFIANFILIMVFLSSIGWSIQVSYLWCGCDGYEGYDRVVMWVKGRFCFQCMLDEGSTIGFG